MVTTEILFREEGFDTDLTLYRERASLLIPQKGQRNSFSVIRSNGGMRFYISSTNEAGLEYMKAFFKRLYPCTFDEQNIDSLKSTSMLIIKLSPWNLRRKSTYNKAFMRGLLHGLSSINGLEFHLCVIVESSRVLLSQTVNFGFAIRIDLAGDPVHFPRAEIMIRDAISLIRKEKGFRIRITKKEKFRFYRRTLRDPFDLCNVIRIPQDEELS